jgi:hypothetical protein
MIPMAFMTWRILSNDTLPPAHFLTIIYQQNFHPLIILRFTKKSTSPIQNLLHLDSAWTMAADLTLSIVSICCCCTGKRGSICSL